MAAIEKRGPYQWRAKIRKKGYPQQSRTFETKAKVERWAKKIESEMDDGVFVSRAQAERTTFGELLDRYRKEITPRKKGSDVETLRLKAIRKHHLFDRPLSTVSGNDIAAYRNERLQKVSPNTVLKELNILRHIIDIGIKEWGIYLPANPVRLVRRPPAAKPRDRRLHPDEERRLYEALDHGTRNPWIKPIVEFALETAMRRSEILNLTWDNIDLKQQVAHLPDTKNGASRSIPLSTRAVRVLEGLPRHIEGLAFPIGTYSLKHAFVRALKRTEIKGFTFHDLRHEATSRLFEKGLNIMEVSAITGHKDLSMLKRYTHLRAEDLARKLG